MMRRLIAYLYSDLQLQRYPLGALGLLMQYPPFWHGWESQAATVILTSQFFPLKCQKRWLVKKDKWTKENGNWRTKENLVQMAMHGSQRKVRKVYRLRIQIYKHYVICFSPTSHVVNLRRLRRALAAVAEELGDASSTMLTRIGSAFRRRSDLAKSSTVGPTRKSNKDSKWYHFLSSKSKSRMMHA